MRHHPTQEHHDTDTRQAQNPEPAGSIRRVAPMTMDEEPSRAADMSDDDIAPSFSHDEPPCHGQPMGDRGYADEDPKSTPQHQLQAL